MKRVAVAILNWNGKHWLEKFLPNVLRYSVQAQIYIIDNASNDDSINFVQENFLQVKIISNKENLGFTEGYNQGLKQIDEEIYCLLNSDVEVTEGWLNPILALFEMDKDIAITRKPILNLQEREVV